jgi:hypothetical protein
MAAEAAHFDGSTELLRYEQQFDQFSRRFPVVVLCQYDVREFDGPTILAAMKSHPDLYEVGLGTFLV